MLAVDQRRDLSYLPARGALGASMLYHGTSKLKPEGLEAQAGFFESLNLKPARFWVAATGVAETLAGALTLLGIGTRVAALAVLATQGVAVWKVHSSKGFDITNGGFEYNLALMGIATALLLTGPGRISAHELLEHRVERKRLARFRPRQQKALRLIRLLK
jgi:putative oxidoreductase